MKLYLTVVVIFAAPAACFSQLNPFEGDVSREEITRRLEVSDEEVVRTFGVELIESVLFKATPYVSVDPSEPQVTSPVKSEFPVIRLFCAYPAAMLDFLKTSDWLDLPAFPEQLETIAYVLFETHGQDEATEMVTGYIASSDGFRKDNWNQVAAFLKDPLLKRGLILSFPRQREKFADYTATRIRIRRIRAEGEARKFVKSVLAAQGPRDVSEDLLRIMDALEVFQKEAYAFPKKMSELVEKELISSDELIFANPDGSLSVPDYFPGLSTEADPKAVVLRLVLFDRGEVFKVTVDRSLLVEAVPTSDAKPEAD